jgi:hypothetical protein
VAGDLQQSAHHCCYYYRRADIADNCPDSQGTETVAVAALSGKALADVPCLHFQLLALVAKVSFDRNGTMDVQATWVRLHCWTVSCVERLWRVKIPFLVQLQIVSCQQVCKRDTKYSLAEPRQGLRQ